METEEKKREKEQDKKENGKENAQDLHETRVLEKELLLFCSRLARATLLDLYIAQPRSHSCFVTPRARGSPARSGGGTTRSMRARANCLDGFDGTLFFWDNFRDERGGGGGGGFLF